MPITTNTNIASFKAQQRLGTATALLKNSFEKLSSGLRINRVSDDAAGLAVSSGLNVGARIYGQGKRNINDAISLYNIAEGAGNELSSILIRIQELSEQSANGTLGQAQRNALDGEAQALRSEYNRIVSVTSFNGNQLFSSTTTSLSVEAGGSSIDFSGALLNTALAGDGTFKSATTITTANPFATLRSADFNNDGLTDITVGNNILISNGNGTFQNFSPGILVQQAVDVNGDGKVDILGGNNGQLDRFVQLGNADGTFSAPRTAVALSGGATNYASLAAGDLNGDGKIDLVMASATDNRLYISIGNGNGTFLAATNETVSSPNEPTLADVNGDGKLDILFGGTTNEVIVKLGNGNGYFTAGSNYYTGNHPSQIGVADFNQDGINDLSVSVIITGLGILLGNSNGSFSAVNIAATGNVLTHDSGDFNGDGYLDLVMGLQGGTTQIVFGNGNGTFKSPVSFGAPDSSFGILAVDLNNDGVDDIAINNSNFVFHTSNTIENPLLPSFSIKSKAGAKQTLDSAKTWRSNLNSSLGKIGANVSRLFTATNIVDVGREQYSAAASQIVDVDIATESSQMLRQQIIQQVAASVLTQANLQPQIVLRLLGA